MSELKLNKEHLESKVKDVEYIRIPNTTTTICIITLENGFVVTGQSSCLEPSNFNDEIGRDIAYQNAFDKLWDLFGFLAKEEMYRKYK